jgi:hypothetical protein
VTQPSTWAPYASFDDALLGMARLAVSKLQWEIFTLFAKHREPRLIRAFYMAGKENPVGATFRPPTSEIDHVLTLATWGEETSRVLDLTKRPPGW